MPHQHLFSSLNDSGLNCLGLHCSGLNSSGNRLRRFRRLNLSHFHRAYPYSGKLVDRKPLQQHQTARTRTENHHILFQPRET